MVAARWVAVVVIVAIGTAAFVLSFVALRELALLARLPSRWAWLFPVIIDGTIVQATVSALVLANSRERRWFTGVLIVGAAVSIAGNALHAVMAGHPLPPVWAAVVAAIAPISLLADTHGLAVLVRAAQQDSVPIPESIAATEPLPDLSAEAEPEPVAVSESPPAQNNPVPAAVTSPRPQRRSHPRWPLQAEMLPLEVGA